MYDDADDETAPWRTFTARWWSTYKDKEVTVGLLWSLLHPSQGDPIDLRLGSGSEHSMKTCFGMKLMGVRDRRFGVHRLVLLRKKQGAAVWQLKPAGKVDAPAAKADQVGRDGEQCGEARQPDAQQESAEQQEARSAAVEDVNEPREPGEPSGCPQLYDDPMINSIFQ